MPPALPREGPLSQPIGIDQRDGMPIIKQGVGRLNADDACADNNDVHFGA